MSCVFLSRHTVFFSLVAALLLSSTSQALAQGTAAVAASNAVDVFQFPTGNDAAAYHAFMMRLLSYQPPTQEEMAKYEASANELLDAAAQKILSLDRNPDSPPFRLAQKYVLASQLLTIDQTSPQDRDKIIQIVTGNLGHKMADQDDIEIALGVIDSLEYIGDYPHAVKACQSFSQVLITSQVEDFRDLGKMMTGMARRLDLLGKPIQMVGTLVDGRPLNWEQYRGKVVLIDFWATWCGPCRAEMPNIKKYYDAYRAAGFEVVGISLDEDRAKLDAFLQSNPLPWVTVNDQGGKNPTAEHYSVTSLPTTILVDREGRVVSLEARGENLGKALQQLLGPLP